MSSTISCAPLEYASRTVASQRPISASNAAVGRPAGVVVSVSYGQVVAYVVLQCFPTGRYRADTHALPFELIADDTRDEIALRIEVRVERAIGEVGIGHHCGDTRPRRCRPA